MAGAGADSIGATGALTSGYIDAGAGVALVSASGNINDSTLLGGSSDDTFDLSQSLVGNSRIITGAGNDVVKFLGAGWLTPSLVLPSLVVLEMTASLGPSMSRTPTPVRLRTPTSSVPLVVLTP